MDKICFWMAVPLKDKVGRSLAFAPMGRRRFSDYVDYSGLPKYCAIIRGYAKKSDDGGQGFDVTTEVFFMSKDTPYAVWREPGSAVRCIMRLDLQNPQECEEIPGSAQEVLKVVAERIKEEGTPGYPDFPDPDVGTRMRRFLRTMRG